MNALDKRKILFLFFCLVSLFIAVIIKAFVLQVYDREKLIEYSESQIIRTNTIYPNRGTIYDRNGSPLALNVKTYNLFTVPKDTKKIQRSLRSLSKLVPSLTYSYLKNKVKKRKRYTWLARKISLSKDQVEKVEKLDDIYLEKTTKRHYPNQELLAQTLGFVGIDNTGLAGVEYFFNEKLQGSPHKTKYIRDAKGRALKMEKVVPGEEPIDIVLSIDKGLQAHLESKLKEVTLKHEAKISGAAVMDALTGEILAMANYPTFNPNQYNKSNAVNRRLSFVTDPFEPGSIFKTLTISSGIENKIIRPDTNYYCEKGKLKVENHYITEADTNKRHEWLSVSEILKYSSNIGTTKIAFDLTYPRLRQSIKDYKFGEKTGIEVAGESRGIFRDVENINPLELSNISFGQGIATTAIQTIAFYAAIANGGNYVKPTLIKQKFGEVETENIISKKTTEEVTKMLTAAVESGTGRRARIPFFKIAGKTSTAQKASNKGTYDGYISGFIGYPIKVKRPFVIYVYVEEPQGKDYYGGVVAAPVFKEIAEYILYKNKEYSEIRPNVAHSKAINDMIGIKHSSKIVIEEGKVPSFIGLDKISVNKLAEKLGVKIRDRGIGVVSKQFPLSGSDMVEGQVIDITYRPPTYD